MTSDVVTLGQDWAGSEPATGFSTAAGSPDTKTPKTKIFISHLRRNMAFADRLEAALKANDW
jgi:hypothetical protein